jgi:transcriptional regulator with XRE-family HTH domain
MENYNRTTPVKGQKSAEESLLPIPQGGDAMMVDNLRRNFRNAEYAYAYTDGFLNSRIATQIKVIREQRGWTQQILATEAGMMQARISVLENVNYSAWSISTLRRIARALGVRLNVSFEEFGTLVPELGKFDRASLQRQPLSKDPIFGIIKIGSGIKDATDAPSPRPPIGSFEKDEPVGALSKAS